MGAAIAVVVVGILLLVFGFCVWLSISVRVADLSDYVKNRLSITPANPGGPGTVSARLFEAMKEVCDTAKAMMEADEQHYLAKEDGGALVSDVDQLWRAYLDANKEFKLAVNRLRKVEGTHEISKR